MGIAGALVIPSMSETGVLRVQAAVRTVVSDITFAQSDAVAFQEQRAIVFDTDASTYSLVSVPGDQVDVASNIMYDPTRASGLYVVNFHDEAYGGARITDVNFDTENTLIFDAMGGPVASAGSEEPSSGGTIRIAGSGDAFIVTVEAFTGRVTVAKEAAAPIIPSGGG